MSLVKLAIRTKSDKERTEKSILYMSVNIATAGAMYSELTGIPVQDAVQKFIDGELVAGDLLSALIEGYNALEAKAKK